MKKLFFNGEIYISSENLAEAFVVADQKLLFVGSYDEAKKYIKEGDLLINLEGRFVSPGFIDSHLHLIGYGSILHMVHLNQCHSLVEMLDILTEYTKGVDRGHWIQGRGWNQDFFEDLLRFPNRYDLDLVSVRHPIVITRACGHICAVNSMALELAQVTWETLQPHGGCFDLDELGEPNGIFRENGIGLITKAMPVPAKEDIKTYIKEACRKLNSYGITSCHSDDFITFSGVEYPVIIQAYEELEDEGALTVKVYEQSHFTSLEGLKGFVEKGYYTGAGRDFFRIGPLKMLGDGSLGARTAYMSEPYLDDPSTCGIVVYSQDIFDEMIMYAHTHNMQVAIHAIGDRVMDMVINGIEKALIKFPRKDHRHGVIHCQITTERLLKRFWKLNLHAYIQSIFLDYDIRIVEDRIGGKRAKETYNFKTLMDYGCGVSNGSDSPVEPPDVLAGIQCAVTRTTLDGNYGPFIMEQALTLEEAINSYTYMGARASFEEKVKGKMEKGMVADFVILAENPFYVSKDKIKDIKVKATYVNGNCVYMQ